jgi:hypothetical protein
MQDIMISVIRGLSKDVASDAVSEVVQEYIFESQVNDIYKNKWLVDCLTEVANGIF